MLTFREGLGDLQSSPGDGARRATAQQALFLDQTARHGERIVVVGLDPLVAQLAVEDGRDEVVADTFDEVAVDAFSVEFFGLGQNRAVGIDTNNLQRVGQSLTLLKHNVELLALTLGIFSLSLRAKPVKAPPVPAATTT